MNQPAAHVPPPADLTLSPAEKTLIRNRSAIMARHLRGDSSSDDALTARLGAALSPLGVDPAHVGPMEGPRGLAARALAPPFAAAEAAADARGAWAREFGRGGVSGDWVGDFAKMRVAVDGDANAVSSAAAAAAAARSPAGPQTWAEEYSGVKQSSGGAWSMGSGEARTGASGATRPGDAWAGEFARERRTEDETSARAASSASEPLTAAQAETAAQSARLAETLSADPDAKFRSSQFLRFVSRMSRGEIVVEGDGVKEVAAPEPSAAHRATGAAWADEFAAAAPGPDAFAASSASASARWADEFRQNSASASAAASSGPSDAAHRWADEFADVPDQWAREFEEMRRDGGDWAHESVWDQIAAETATRRAAERSRYDFVDPNPYLGREDALEVGRDLFRRGVLSEAALALEAAVRADPDLCEGWRLLGTVHAENDDDRRAIAAMTRANEADPSDPEVLLSLGVSHTNELDQEEAIGHMRRWLRGQTRFAALEAEHAASMGGAPDTPDSALGLFRRAAAAAPGDADVHAVLGVLAHLSRSYDEAIDAFNTALDINPQDYSLWNKLGATQANSARSADAMRAYQRARSISNPITCARGPTWASGSPTRENTRRAWRITCARWDSTRGRRACGGTCGFRSGAAGGSTSWRRWTPGTWTRSPPSFRCDEKRREDEKEDEDVAGEKCEDARPRRSCDDKDARVRIYHARRSIAISRDDLPRLAAKRASAAASRSSRVPPPRPRPRPRPAAGNLAFLSVFVATIDAFVPCTVSVVVASAVARAIASSSAAVAASTSTSTSTALSRVLRTSSPIVATRAGALVIVGVVRGGVPAVVARAAGLVATRVARARLVATKGCPRALPGVRVGVGGISVIPEAVPARLERVPRARAHPSPLRDERTGVVVRRASGPVDSSHRQSRRREGRSAVLRHLGDPLLARTSPKRARVDVARIRPISGDDDPSEKVMSRGSR